jgi:hypothetical protein
VIEPPVSNLLPPSLPAGMRCCRALVAYIALECLLAAWPALSAPVIIVGDSWVYGEDNALKQVFRERKSNLTNDALCRPGSAAREWANDPSQAARMLDKNPDVRVVMVSLGGNDIISMGAGGHKPAEIGEAVRGWVDQVIKAMQKKKSGLHYVLNTYVYLPLGADNRCGEVSVRSPHK